MAALTVVVLGACSPTSNSGSLAAATPSTCTLSWDGTYRDQNGNPCSATGLNYSCNSTPYTYTGGTAYCGSQYTLPPQGYYNSGGSTQYIGGGATGCQQWSYYYGQTYVPVNLGGGQLMCVSWSYLQSYMNQSWGSYYQDPSYWYSYPPQVYSGNYGGYSGGYYGGSYCQGDMNFGFSSGDFSAGVSLCF